MTFHVPEHLRVKVERGQPLYSDISYGNNGFFMVGLMRVIASDGEGWEHVSVSLPSRVPEWDGMCNVKDLFWDEEDVVIQYHPAKSEYVNHHTNCLHLWRPVGIVLPTPPTFMIGPTDG